MNTAIIVAAGSGKRFAADTPKQFIEILGKPLIIHTLEKFDACPAIDEILLVLSDDGRKRFDAFGFGETAMKPFRVVTGGETRAHSVRNALDEVDPEHSDVIAVHDGARPLVSVDEITRTVEKAHQGGAACLVADVTDTIKEIDGEFIHGTVDRSKLKRALTPQAFQYEVLRRAFDAAELIDAVTDECYLVEKTGVRIAFVEGSAVNIKITRPEDLMLAEAFLRDIQNK